MCKGPEVSWLPLPAGTELPKPAMSTEQLLRGEQYQQIIDLFSSLSESEKKNTSWMKAFIVSLIKTGRIQEATQFPQHCLALVEPEQVSVFSFYAAYCLYRSGKFAVALSMLQESGCLEQVFSDGISVLNAQLLYELGQYRGALAGYKELLSIGALESRAYGNLLACLVALAKDEGSESAHLSSFPISFNRSLLSTGCGNDQNAAELLKSQTGGLRDISALSLAQTQLGFLMLKLGRSGEALEYLRAAAERSTNELVRLVIANNQAAAGDCAAARAFLRKLRSNFPLLLSISYKPLQLFFLATAATQKLSKRQLISAFTAVATAEFSTPLEKALQSFLAARHEYAIGNYTSALEKARGISPAPEPISLALKTLEANLLVRLQKFDELKRTEPPSINSLVLPLSNLSVSLENPPNDRQLQLRLFRKGAYDAAAKIPQSAFLQQMSQLLRESASKPAPFPSIVVRNRSHKKNPQPAVLSLRLCPERWVPKHQRSSAPRRSQKKVKK